MEHQNCWEFWNCPEEERKGCPAFITNCGMHCYDFSENCPRAKKEFKDCRVCPWYEMITSEAVKKENEIRSEI